MERIYEWYQSNERNVGDFSVCLLSNNADAYGYSFTLDDELLERVDLRYRGAHTIEEMNELLKKGVRV